MEETDRESRSSGIEQQTPIKAWFLGPRAENADDFEKLIAHILDLYKGWRTYYCPENDPKVISSDEITHNQPIYNKLRDDLDDLMGKLRSDFPFFSPRYIGHMLSDQSMPAMLGYFAAMLRNSNNVTPQAASVTVGLELEVAKSVALMLGFDRLDKTWAHICSGGTIANLEALWAARAVQFLPLCLKELCEKAALEITLTTPDGSIGNLKDIPAEVLIALNPSEALHLGIDVKQKLKDRWSDRSFCEQIKASSFLEALGRCDFNPQNRGLHAVYRKLELTPVIMVSAAAHYSIGKAVQILGYGEDSVKRIPVDSRFRLDMQELRNAFGDLTEKQYVAAVIGIVGTTEEGAVDPVQDIVNLRTEREIKFNRSFWLHLDAAWGGYFASIFNVTRPTGRAEWRRPNINSVIDNQEFLAVLDERDRTVKWDENEVLSAYESIREADSVTVDPHKTGYIPYPAGMIVFKDNGLKELLLQKAQYITSDGEAAQSNMQENMGPYIVEGSKPGAAAAACWLAHKTIPLDSAGHGLLMKECLLNAQTLTVYLKQHKLIYEHLELDYVEQGPGLFPFTFVPITNPDTNVVTFIAVPATMRTTNENEAGGKRILVPALHSINRDLAWMKKLNQSIYEELSVKIFKDRHQSPQNKKFFISHTEFSEEQYTAESLKDLLKAIDANEDDYKKHGLYILRATVMNPFYGFSRHGGGLLFKFLEHLHELARNAIRKVW